MVKHRVGIIGLGIMGRRMVVNFNNHPLFEIVGVWDPSEQSISKTRNENPSILISESPTEMISDGRIDLLYIACPPEFHKEYALMAIEQKIPVYLEKPLGVDLSLIHI